ncbi:hypothetical protein GCM10028819_43620 [Spirosoma humi]
MRTNFVSLLVAAGVAFTLYLSWLPKPQLGLMWFIPDWLATWTDANENETLRTGVPFVILGLIIGSWLQKMNYSWYYWAASWLGLVTVVLLAETGQLFLPQRRFDWWDVIWGATGAILGLSSAIFAKRLKAML